MATPNTTTPRKGLLGTLFPRVDSVALAGEGAGKPAIVQALEMEVAHLRGVVEAHQAEQAPFRGREPFFPGSEHLEAIVPPMPGASLRAAADTPSMTGMLLHSDAWQALLGKFIKPNAFLLEVGCGAGQIARTLTYHPHIRKYVGFDALKEGVDCGREVLVPRIGDKFEFQHVDVACHSNPGGALKATDVRFPAGDCTVDLAWAGSIFTHLAESDARHFLREVHRVLGPSGLFLAAVGGRPEAGAKYSGDEARFDVDLDYFAQMADECGLTLIVRLGETQGRFILIFRLKPEQSVSGILNVGGQKSEAEMAEAMKPKEKAVPLPPNGGVHTDEMLRLNKVYAEQNQVTEIVHPKDYIYWFVTVHPEMSLQSAIQYYFETGAETAVKLDGHLARLFPEKKEPIKLLEFASGYGCVSRHLKKNPRFDLTASDIHPDAIEFLQGEIGVKALQSAHTPETFTTPEKYDAIFALSFFSHMPKSTFGRWIKALYDALAPGGHLLFTTHGVKSCKGLGITLDDADDEGFWFASHSEQHDLDGAEYGLTLSLPQYVMPTIFKAVGAPVADFREGEWWKHQDLWIVKREG